MNSAAAPARTPRVPVAPADQRTRDRIVRLLHEKGPQSASDLASALHLSATGIRRHLDELLEAGTVETVAAPVTGTRPSGAARRGPGRPARRYRLTDAGRQVFPHAYDDLAVAALERLAAVGGRDLVRAFAADQLAPLEQRCRAAMDGAGDDPARRAEALAAALTAEGYAATASGISSGGQLCQHHCPVAQVAARFPELCDAETAVIGRLVGSHVQRLATIAHGDGVCTTHLPRLAVPAVPADPSASTPEPDRRPVPTPHAGGHR